MRVGQCVQLQVAAGLQRRRVAVQAAAAGLRRLVLSRRRREDTIQRRRIVATAGRVRGQVGQSVGRRASERHHPDVDAGEGQVVHQLAVLLVLIVFTRV